MPTQLLSQSEAFTGMSALRGSSISMQFLSCLKNLTPLCENKPEMISLARIRLRHRKQNPAYAGCHRSSVFEAERRLSRAAAQNCILAGPLRKGFPIAARSGPRRPACNHRASHSRKERMRARKAYFPLDISRSADEASSGTQVRRGHRAWLTPVTTAPGNMSMTSLQATLLNDRHLRWRNGQLLRTPTDRN
jgi:hypothetical protein